MKKVAYRKTARVVLNSLGLRKLTNIDRTIPIAHEWGLFYLRYLLFTSYLTTYTVTEEVEVLPAASFATA